MLDRTEDYGRGVAQIDLDQFEREQNETKRLIADTGLLVKKTLTSKDFRPPLLPEIALSLSDLVNRRNVQIKEVEAVVSRDPTVAARVVSVANSVFYNRSNPVKSLKDAIMRLGLHEVRDVAFQVVAQTTIFRVPGYSDRMRELFVAGSYAGLFAREICQTLKFESETAYLCGLLHDMGEAIILAIIAKDAKTKDIAVKHDDLVVTKVVELFHASAGALICSHWGLPQIVCNAINHHHNPDASDDTSKMATVVAVSDLLLEHIGAGVPERTISPLEEPLFYQLNLTPQQVEHLLEFAQNVQESQDVL